MFLKDMRTEEHVFLLRQENMRTRGPFPAPLSATRFANILHISFQLLSRYINSAPLTCAPRIGKALGRWAGACLLRLARAKEPRFRVRDRVLASSERWFYWYRASYSSCRLKIKLLIMSLLEGRGCVPVPVVPVVPINVCSMRVLVFLYITT